MKQSRRCPDCQRPVERIVKECRWSCDYGRVFDRKILPAAIRVPLIILTFFFSFMGAAWFVSTQLSTAQPHPSFANYLFGTAFTAAFVGAYGASRLLGKPKPLRSSQIALSSRPEELVVPGPVEGPPDLGQKWTYFPIDNRQSQKRSTIFACGCFPALGLAYALPPLGIPVLVCLLAYSMLGPDQKGQVSFDSQRKGLVLETGGSTRFYAASDLFLVGTDTVSVPDPDDSGTIGHTVPAIVTRQGQILRVGEPGTSPVTAGAAAERIAGALGLPTMFGSGQLCVEMLPGKEVAVYYTIDHLPVDPDSSRKRAIFFECWLPLIGIVVAFLAAMMMNRSQ